MTGNPGTNGMEVKLRPINLNCVTLNCGATLQVASMVYLENCDNKMVSSAYMMNFTPCVTTLTLIIALSTVS